MRPIVDNRIIVIGDIHGCIYTLKNLIDTGACFDNTLTAAVINGNDIEIISISKNTED